MSASSAGDDPAFLAGAINIAEDFAFSEDTKGLRVGGRAGRWAGGRVGGWVGAQSLPSPSSHLLPLPFLFFCRPSRSPSCSTLAPPPRRLTMASAPWRRLLLPRPPPPPQLPPLPQSPPPPP